MDQIIDIMTRTSGLQITRIPPLSMIMSLLALALEVAL